MGGGGGGARKPMITLSIRLSQVDMKEYYFILSPFHRVRRRPGGRKPCEILSDYGFDSCSTLQNTLNWSRVHTWVMWFRPSQSTWENDFETSRSRHSYTYHLEAQFLPFKGGRVAFCTRADHKLVKGPNLKMNNTYRTKSCGFWACHAQETLMTTRKLTLHIWQISNMMERKQMRM